MLLHRDIARNGASNFLTLTLHACLMHPLARHPDAILPPRALLLPTGPLPAAHYKRKDGEQEHSVVGFCSPPFRQQELRSGLGTLYSTWRNIWGTIGIRTCIQQGIGAGIGSEGQAMDL